MTGFVKEFKDFIASGNMIELAVAFILGAAVAAVINAFTKGIMMQIVAAIFGQSNFDDVTITLRKNVSTDELTGEPVDATLQIGAFVNTLISLVLTGLVLFFIIKGYTKLKERRVAAEEEAQGPTEVELLTEIRDALLSRA